MRDTNTPLELAVKQLLSFRGDRGNWVATDMGRGENSQHLTACAAIALATAARSGRLNGTLAAEVTDIAVSSASDLLDLPCQNHNLSPASYDDQKVDMMARKLTLCAVTGRTPREDMLKQGLRILKLKTCQNGAGRDAFSDYWARPLSETDQALALALFRFDAISKADLERLWRGKIVQAQRADSTWNSYWLEGYGYSTATACEFWYMAGRPDPAPETLHGFWPEDSECDRILMTRAQTYIDSKVAAVWAGDLVEQAMSGTRWRLQGVRANIAMVELLSCLSDEQISKADRQSVSAVQRSILADMTSPPHPGELAVSV